MKKSIIIIFVFLLISQLSFSQQKALAGDNRINVRNSPSTKNSKVLYQLNAGDEITVFSSIGDKSFSDGVLNYWYKISQDNEEWINAEFVYIFPCDFVHIIWEYKDVDRFDRVVLRDYKKENGILYFYIDYIDNLYRSSGYNTLKKWVEASELDWIGNKSKNVVSFIKSFTDSYNDNYLINNIDLFKKEPSEYFTYYKLSDYSDEIIYIAYPENLTEENITLYEINLCSYDKIYPYGLKLGMTIDELIEKIGGYDKIINNEYLYYQRENEFNMSVFFENNIITKIRLYCGM